VFLGQVSRAVGTAATARIAAVRGIIGPFVSAGTAIAEWGSCRMPVIPSLAITAAAASQARRPRLAVLERPAYLFAGTGNPCGCLVRPLN
jgi:hypothetical protein